MKTYYEAIKDLADDFMIDYEDKIKEIIRENKDETAEEIYDKIYQEWYLLDNIHEFLDGAWYGFLRSEWCDDRETELGSAVKVIEESNEIETDSGLWEGKDPEGAIMAQAFFTVSNDLYLQLEKDIKEMIEEELSQN